MSYLLEKLTDGPSFYHLMNLLESNRTKDPGAAILGSKKPYFFRETKVYLEK